MRGVGPIGGEIRPARMPLPDSDRTIDILDTYVAAILETNVDPIADAFVDDRGDADFRRARRAAPSVRRY